MKQRCIKSSICILALLTSAGAVIARPDDDAVLSLDEARGYLLELINKDRAALGKSPVMLDAAATTMGQKQAELMVSVAAMSHADLEGRLPIQRYTEAGGVDRVRENV